MIMPPDSAFHAHTFSTNLSRPMARRFGSCRSIIWRSTTICVAMPAWSMPGCQSTSRPRMRSKRTRMSCSVLLSACPMWSEPVTFGGGMTIENGSAPGSAPAPARKAPAFSQRSRILRLDARRVVGLVEHGGPGCGGGVKLTPLRPVNRAYGHEARRRSGGRAELPNPWAKTALAPAARDPLDLLLNLALDDRGQVVVEPLLQHRLQHLGDDVLERARGLCARSVWASAPKAPEMASPDSGERSGPSSSSTGVCGRDHRRAQPPRRGLRLAASPCRVRKRDA